MGAMPGEAQLIFKKAMDHLRSANSLTGARAQLCACESDPANSGQLHRRSADIKPKYAAEQIEL